MTGHADKGFGTLELIITAPVVVASWISLQYYASAVAPDVFGGGNKLIHNVVGGIGVLQGNGGTLRAGLPWQAVHDGETLVHEPLRLTVMIEAPQEAISRRAGASCAMSRRCSTMAGSTCSPSRTERSARATGPADHGRGWTACGTPHDGTHRSINRLRAPACGIPSSSPVTALRCILILTT